MGPVLGPSWAYFEPAPALPRASPRPGGLKWAREKIQGPYLGFQKKRQAPVWAFEKCQARVGALKKKTRARVRASRNYGARIWASSKAPSQYPGFEKVARPGTGLKFGGPGGPFWASITPLGLKPGSMLTVRPGSVSPGKVEVQNALHRQGPASSYLRWVSVGCTR